MSGFDEAHAAIVLMEWSETWARRWRLIQPLSGCYGYVVQRMDHHEGVWTNVLGYQSTGEMVKDGWTVIHPPDPAAMS